MAVVGILRGGGPMAYGVFQVLWQAASLNVKLPDDKRLAEVTRGLKAVILVDAVVHSGDTAIAFIQATRRYNPTCKIIFVAGVICRDSLPKLARVTKADDAVRFYALRLSDNSYVGSGSTDTGNRLFNTQSRL